MTEPVDADVRRPGREGPGSTTVVTGGAGTGKTAFVVDRVVKLIETGRASIDDVLCIAGTEGDAAELRTRLHTALARAAALPASTRLADARAGADTAICTMAGLARQVLVEHGATVRVGPGFTVLDAPAERADFDARFARFSDALLADPAAARALVNGFALGLTRDDVHAVAWGLHRRRDRLDDGPQLQLESAQTSPGSTGAAVGDAVAGALDAVLALRGWGIDPEDRLSVHLVGLAAARAELASCGDAQAVLQFLDSRRPFTCALGQQSNWFGHVDEVRAACASAEAARVHTLTITGEAVVGELAVHLGRFALRGAEARRVEARLGVLDLLVLARRALRADADAADALRRRYRYLLVDGLPDDPVELELLERLASAGSGTTLEHLAPLRINVRAVPGIVRFLNMVHGALEFAGDTEGGDTEGGHPEDADTEGGDTEGGDDADTAGELVAARAAMPLLWRPPGRTEAPRTSPGASGAQQLALGGLETPAPHPTLLGAGGGTRRALAAMAGSGASPVVVVGGPMRAAAADVRRAAAHGAATAVVDVVTRGWAVAGGGDGDAASRAARWRDVAVLVADPDALAGLAEAFEAARVPFRVGEATLLWRSDEVRDVLAVLRGADRPTDAVAVLAALRSPGLGCGDDDLVTWRRAGGGWDPRAEAPDGLDAHPVAGAMDVLARLHVERWRCEPSALVLRAMDELRSFALCLAFHRPQDHWHPLRWLVDQARQFDESVGGTLRDFLDWSERRTEDDEPGGRVGPLDEDDDAVQVMTVAGAAGLDFPVVVVTGLEHGSVSGHRPAAVLWDEEGRPQIRARRGLRSAGYEAVASEQVAIESSERYRLLLSAMTRARDHLVLCVHHRESANATPGVAMTLHDICMGHRNLWRRLPVDAGVTAPAPEADHDVWREVRDSADDDSGPWLAEVETFTSRRRVAVEEARRGATVTMAALVGLPRGEDAGTLTAPAALSSPTIARATAGRCWRAVPVAVAMGPGGGVLEGTVDLVIEESDGLTVVDYVDDSLGDAAHDAAEVATRHRVWVGGHALALERATGLPVRRAVLVHLGTSAPFEEVLEDRALIEARASAAELVTRALSGS